MNNSSDLTKGNIASQLLKLALPLIATNFIQVSYNLIDMIWIGRLGSEAVIAIGTAGFILNMAVALFSVIVLGTGIKIAHAFGAKNDSAIEQYIVNGYIMALLLAALYTIITLYYRHEIIGFFHLNNPEIEAITEQYLIISVIGTVFMFCNALYSGIINSLGNSQLSFKLNTVGFVLNILLDPLLIFGLGGYLKLGVVGAAYATIIGRLVVFILSLTVSRTLLKQPHGRRHLESKALYQVIRMGMPVGLQRISFTFIGIIMARIIANYGAIGIGVQKIGLQIESLSFMTMAGLYGAMAAFVGQNYGAGHKDRIIQGYRRAMVFAVGFGGLTMALMLLFPREIFGLIINDTAIIESGIDYLRIIGLSQIFMCVDIVTMGSFNGLGKTYIPAAVSLIFTTLRIPIAMMLSSNASQELQGVWWSISGTSMVRGILTVTLFMMIIRKISFENPLDENLLGQ